MAKDFGLDDSRQQHDGYHERPYYCRLRGGGDSLVSDSVSAHA
jgi:hypothetical protein